ncbi:hypothetical protein [Cnuibacter physcomitrellae]|nr:hypothetical protein [Cnuibacter physcomitrellae]
MIADNVELIAVGIVVVSVIPIAVAFVRERRRHRAEQLSGAPEEPRSDD